MEDNVIFVNTNNCSPSDFGDTLIQRRQDFAKVQQELNGIEVSILIVAFNRLEKTKRCVESVLVNTKDIDYELLLIDSGSDDETLEYYKSVPHCKKRIIKITNNLGLLFACCLNSVVELGRYFVMVSNDIIVTPKWLNNLLICAESDPSIGMVGSVSTNISNLQEVTLTFNSYEEMQKKAGEYNLSDKSKWEERLRLITTIILLKKEAILSIGYPFLDSGFFHDFADDDLSFRIRRMGYKIILAKDVWVYHDHDFRNLEDKDPKIYHESLKKGREAFKEKYFGVDAWDDVNNFLYDDIKQQIAPPKDTTFPRILGIDVKCGTPILDVKNKLREYGYFDVKMSAFSQETKYAIDLRTICEDLVVCDREEFLRDGLLEDYYDYVVIGNPINCYHEPLKVLLDILKLAKKGSQIILPLYNTFSYHEYLNIMGDRELYNSNFAYNIPAEVMETTLNQWCNINHIIYKKFDLTASDVSYLEDISNGFPEAQREECLKRLQIETFWFVTTKL